MRVYEDDFGKKLEKALGLEGRFIKEIHIHAVTDDLVIIEVKEILQKDAANKLVELLSQYTLMKKENSKFEEGDVICTENPITGGDFCMEYKSSLFDSDGFMQLVGWGKIHIANFKKK